MFISDNLYDRTCRYVDLDDRAFFSAALSAARDLEPRLADASLTKVQIKERTPLVHISKFSKQTRADELCDRRHVHGDRARRRFVMMDVDYDADERRESAKTRNKLVAVANRLSTPLMIYPTVSYPEKPRFRAVLLTSRLMDANSHWKAMRWLYDQIGCEPTDDSDMRMNTNRNLPVFDCDEQLSFVYDTFGDGSRTPLDNSLWKKYPDMPARYRPVKNFRPTNPGDHAVKLDPALVVQGARKMALNPRAQKYDTFWQIVASLAAAVACGGLDEDSARRALVEMAAAAPDEATRARWASENQTLFDKQSSQLVSDDALSRTRPLTRYNEFSKCRDVKSAE